MAKDKQQHLQDALTIHLEMYDVLMHIMSKPEEKEIVAVRCPDCGEMVSSFKDHPCTGNAG